MTPLLKIRIKQLLVILACFILLIIITSPFIITLAINTTYVKDKISSSAYQKSGVHVDSSDFSLKLFPTPGIKINHLKFSPADQIEINIQSIKFNLSLQELMKGKLVLEKIIVNRPEIKIMEAKNTGQKEISNETSERLSLLNYMELVSKGFDFLPGDQEVLEIVFKKGLSKYFKQMDGSLLLDKNKNLAVMNAAIKGIQFSPSDLAGPDFDKHIDLDFISIDQLKLSATLDTQNPTQSIRGKCRMIKPRLVAGNKQTLLDTDLVHSDFILSPNMQQVTIKPVSLNYPNGVLGIDFLNIPEKEQTYLKFSGKKIDIEQAREMSLVLLKNVYVSQTLFDILLGGIAPHVDVSFQSKDFKSLLDENNLELSGNINNGKVHIPETQLIVSQINGDVTIRNGILEVISPNGMIGTSKIQTGSLLIDLLNYEDVPFKGEFSLDLDLSMLPKTLIYLLPDTFLANELSRIKKVEGRAKSILNLELKTGSDEPIVHVKTDNFSARGIYERIPGEIIIDAIKVKYQPDMISLNNFNGVINGSKIKNLNADVKFKKKTWFDIKNASAVVNLASTIPWLTSYKKTRDAISPISAGSGSAAISSIKLTGPVEEPDKWKYQATGSIDNVDLSTHKNQKQIHNLSSQYQISQKAKHFENIHMEIDSLSFLEKFSKSEYLSSIQVPFSLENARLRSGTDLSFFNGKLNFPSGPTMQIDLTGNRISSLSFNAIKFIDGDLSDASVSFHHVKNKPLFDFRGRFDTRSLSKIIKSKSYLDNKIKNITEDQPVLIHRGQDSVLNIITKNLNADSFLSNSNNSSTPKSSLLTEDLINFKAQKLTIKKLSFTDVDTKISFKKNHSYVRVRKANLCGLKTQGYINIKNGKVYANLPFQAKNRKDIQELLSCLFQKDEFMDGPYSFTCNLSSEGVEKNKVSSKIQGTMAFDAEEGRIYKLTLLSRILSVLNVSNVFKGKIPNITQKGFAYKKIIIEADIKDSVIHIKKAVIDGNDMTMIFTGSLDPLNDKINLTCLVAPFKTVDMIIEKIPIINTLLGGRLVSVPVKATGDLSDPTVIPLHPSAVGKGLVDMMARIVKSPITLWDKILGEE